MLRQQYDAQIGTRTRMFITLILGVVFVFAPLVGALKPDLMPLSHHVDYVLWTIGVIGFLGALGFWARESLSKTLINRRLFVTGMFMLTAQVALWLGTWQLEVPLAITQVMMLFLWFVIGGMVTITIDRKMAPSHVGFLIGFLVACARPAWALYVMSAVNTVFVANAAWAWRPATLRWSEEERRQVLGERAARRRARS